MLQRRQSRTEPQRQAACSENLVYFECVCPEICERTYRQTDTLCQYSVPYRGGEINVKVVK